MNQLTIAFLIGVVTGISSGLYWAKRGYKGWRLYFTGFIAGFGLSAIVMKSLG